eukprot:gene12559-14523_t
MEQSLLPNRLYSAIERCDVSAVKEILVHASAEEVNQREGNKNGRTALAGAVILGNLEIVRAILDHPCLDVNLPNTYNVLPLMSSFTAEMTQLLLSHPGVNANIVGKERSFRLACKEENLEIVRVLLAVGGFDLNAQNKDGVTALNFAVNQNCESITKELLARPEIDVNKQDNNGLSPLLNASSEEDCPAVLPLLLNHPHVNVNLRHENGYTALSLACAGGFTKTVSLLLRSPTIDVNLPNNIGHTPLLKAADEGRKEICAMLLKHPDIDVNVQSQDGFTALICAAQQGHDWVSLSPAINDAGFVQALLANHVLDVNLRNREGYSALLVACSNQHVEAVKLLLTVPGIDVNAHNEFGHSSLMMVACKENAEIVKLLLAHPNIDVNSGRYPSLIAACASSDNNIEVVKLLLAHPKIDVNAKEEEGGTALWLAFHVGHTETVRYMLSVCDKFDITATLQTMGETIYDGITDADIREMLRNYVMKQTSLYPIGDY